MVSSNWDKSRSGAGSMLDSTKRGSFRTSKKELFVDTGHADVKAEEIYMDPNAELEQNLIIESRKVAQSAYTQEDDDM